MIGRGRVTSLWKEIWRFPTGRGVLDGMKFSGGESGEAKCLNEARSRLAFFAFGFNRIFRLFSLMPRKWLYPRRFQNVLRINMIAHQIRRLLHCGCSARSGRTDSKSESHSLQCQREILDTSTKKTKFVHEQEATNAIGSRERRVEILDKLIARKMPTDLDLTKSLHQRRSPTSSSSDKSRY